jgi:peptidoglycan/LPS O-acetylase OafA/YrhL
MLISMNRGDHRHDLPGGVHSSLTYRSDIDGLRAVAVLPVVLFHAGAGFSGGFVGVDIFFVISGYLISRVLLRDWDRGRYSIVMFYERRVRRIIPALFAVIAFTFVFSAVLLIPKDFRDFSASAVAATTFVSNILFYEQSGYFATAAHYKPLLHTWSLAVEEQFYILYPPLLWISVKYFRRYFPVLIAVGIVLSLAVCQFAVIKRPDMAFYLSPFRAWELLIGCIVALGVFPPVKSDFVRNTASIGAALLLIYPIFFYSPDTPFPGLAALIPCSGAAILLHSHEAGPSSVGRILSSPPFVFIGKISYSLYMWHWPLLVLVRLTLLRPLTPIDGLGVAFLSVGVAYLSWRYIELPFRKPDQVARPQLFRAAAGSAAILLLVAAYGVVSGGMPWRFAPRVNSLAAYSDSTQTAQWLAKRGMKDCFQGESAPHLAAALRCMSVSGEGRDVLVWGDSHAAYAFPGVRELGRREGITTRLVSMASCFPIIYAKMLPGCSSFAPYVAAHVKDFRYSAVVLFGHWYAQERKWEGSSRREAFFADIAKTLKIIGANGTPVILVGPLPEYDEPLPVILARRLAFGGSEAFGAHLKKGARKLDSLMKARFGHLPGIIYVSAYDAMCDRNGCQTMAGDSPIELDESHFSTRGAEKVVPLMLAKPFAGLADRTH